MITYVDFLVDFAASLVLYFLLIYLFRKAPRRCFALNTLAFWYLFCVVLVTLAPVITRLPDIGSFPYRHMILIPFRDLKMGFRGAKTEAVLNVIMTVPLGLLLPLGRRMTGKKCNVFFVLLAGFSLSLFIELSQPLISMTRHSDCTDLITNTTGVLLGYLLFLIIKPLVGQSKRRFSR